MSNSQYTHETLWRNLFNRNARLDAFIQEHGIDKIRISANNMPEEGFFLATHQCKDCGEFMVELILDKKRRLLNALMPDTIYIVLDRDHKAEIEKQGANKNGEEIDD